MLSTSPLHTEQRLQPPTREGIEREKQRQLRVLQDIRRQLVKTLAKTR